MKTIAIAAAFVLVAGPAFAQAPAAKPAPAPAAKAAPKMAAPRAMSSATYVQKTAISDMFEVRAGEIAAQKAQNADVKQFGQMMVKDHTMASTKLKAAVQASDPKLVVPTRLDARHTIMLTKLRNARGAAFDRLYVRGQVAAHQEGLALQKAYAQSGDMPALKKHAAEASQVVGGHLGVVQKLNQKVGS